MVNLNEMPPLEARVEQLEKKLATMHRAFSLLVPLLAMALFYSLGSAWFGFGKHPIGRFEAVSVGRESAIEASLYRNALNVGTGAKRASLNVDDGTSLRLDDKTSEIYMSADRAMPSISLSAGGVTYRISVDEGQLRVRGWDDEMNQSSTAVLHDFREPALKAPLRRQVDLGSG